MNTAFASLTALASALTLTACATPPAQVLAGMEPQAVDIALQRGRIDLQCLDPQPKVLSQELQPPVIETLRYSFVQRGVFTIGISGCDKQKAFQIVCPDGYGCFPAEGPDDIQ